MKPETRALSSEWTNLRQIWKLAGPRRSDLTLAILFRMLQAIALGLAFYAAILLVTFVMETGTVTTVLAWKITCLAILSLILQLIFSYLHVRRAWDASYQVGRSLRLLLLAHLQNLPMGFHLARHQGDTATVLTTDIAMIEGFMSDALAKIVQAIVLPLVLILFIAAKTPPLALALLLPLIIGVPLLVWVVRQFSWVGLARQGIQAKAGAVMIEYVQGIRVIRAFNQVAIGQEMFRAALDQFRKISIQMVLLLAFPMVAYAAVIMLGVPIVVAFTGALHDQVTPQSSITVLILVFAIYGPLVGLAGILERLRITEASLQRLELIFNSEPLKQIPNNQNIEDASIHFENVGFSYEADRTALSNVSFQCDPRSMTAIVGPSGSGKTTILNLLSRFWDVSSGRVTIGGADVRSLTPVELSNQISVVFQNVHLFSGTVKENIAAGAQNISADRIKAAARAARAHDFITDFPEGYDTPIGEGGARLSGGQRQRIAIARAILKDAPIIILDEATAALDPTNERAIQEALSALVVDKTILIVAHKLSTIEAADQILVLEKGHVTACGKHSDLLRQGGLYARMYNRKARTAEWRIV